MLGWRVKEVFGNLRFQSTSSRAVLRWTMLYLHDMVWEEMGDGKSFEGGFGVKGQIANTTAGYRCAGTEDVNKQQIRKGEVVDDQVYGM